MGSKAKYRNSTGNPHNHRIYRVWWSMLSRCTDPKCSDYESYGGRGIKVCPEWLSFDTFADWAWLNGYSQGLQIDRVDNDGSYCPDNCRWVECKKNCRNKRTNHLITHNGQTKCIAEWAEELGISRQHLRMRLIKGQWPRKAS